MSNQQNQDNSSDLIWIGAALLVVFLLLKVFLGEQVLSLWLQTRLWWIAVIDLIWPWPLESLGEAAYKIRAYHTNEWGNGAAGALARDLRPFIWPLFAIPLAWYGWSVWKKNPGNRFRRPLTRERLLASEQGQWPWTVPVRDLDLVSQSIDKGPWAMEKNPLEFARHYRLLDGNTLNPERAAKLFASQLGPLWEGPDKLRSHERALFACFIAQACRNRKEAQDGLTRLARTMTSGQPDYAFVDGLLAKHMDDPLIKDIVSRHAYVATVISASLKAARKIGVLPPNFFLWLRPINRPLWYTLNCVGRHTPFAGVAGAHAHRLAEEVAGHAIEIPYVEKTVDALRRALDEVKM